MFGPPGTAAVLREILAPFKDLKIFGATETASRATGGTDSTSFNNAGLPGIGFGQDPIEYGSHTWHTNLDTYERIVEQDVRDAAVVVAATLYHLAMRPDPLPRFAPDKMRRRRRRPRRRGGGRDSNVPRLIREADESRRLTASARSRSRFRNSRGP